MPQDVGCEQLDILGHNVIALVQPGISACASIQRHGGAWTGAVLYPPGQLFAVAIRAARRHDDFDNVILETVVEVDVEHRIARIEQALLADNSARGRLQPRLRACLGAGHLEYCFFVRRVRKIDAHVHQKTVELGLG